MMFLLDHVHMVVIFKLTNIWGTVNAELRVYNLCEAFSKLKFGTAITDEIIPELHIVLSTSNWGNDVLIFFCC